MRRLPILLLATAWTLSYGWVAQAAIVADLATAGTRPLRAAATPEPVWYGGTLPPVVVEAPAGRGDLAAVPEACPAPERGAARGATRYAPTLRVM